MLRSAINKDLTEERQWINQLNAGREGEGDFWFPQLRNFIFHKGYVAKKLIQILQRGRENGLLNDVQA